MIRLVTLLGGLSAMTDLGTGAPLEESLKRAVVATRLARTVGSSEAVVRDTLYVALLQHLGCTAHTYEVAQVWGDDVAITRLAFLTDTSRPWDVLTTFAGGVASKLAISRARVIARMLTVGRSIEANGPIATCEVARDAAVGLGLPPTVCTSLFHTRSAWDGSGYPKVAGEVLPVAIRLVHVADCAVLFSLHAGPEVARVEVARRSGRSLDPDLCAAVEGAADALLADLADLDGMSAVAAAEPDPVQWVAEESMEQVARTFGHLADLKSPGLLGHSAAVADLCGAAARQLGLGESGATMRVAGYVHDIGKVAVSSRIWTTGRAWTAAEGEQARLHAYHGERILARTPQLAVVANLVGQHHERCDGSGYHRGLTGASLSPEARVLAAADAYRCWLEPAPGREAEQPAGAAGKLRADARDGRLDADAVDAVLVAAGEAQPGEHTRLSGLTERQVEVLRLVATGLSNRQIADRLTISPRTAEHHVQDIYQRIGVSSRAAAALYAMQHGLLTRVD